MKLCRVGALGEERPAVLVGDAVLDVSRFVDDYNEAFFASGGLLRLRDWLATHQAECPVLPSMRIGSCVARPSKIVCIGLNYAAHAAETGAPIPKEPVVFTKATSALSGPDDDVVLPRGSMKTDWEVELAVVIEKRASYVSEEDAMSYVAGYSLHNDYSERSFQIERGGQWVKGKSCDTFAPLGPVLVTKDEIGNPNDLRLWLKVNGQMRQDSNTSDQIFKIPTLVSYLSQFMSLLPGDVISTGTPAGVGQGMKPQVFLKHGDVVELGIEGLGTARQQIVAYEQRGKA